MCGGTCLYCCCEGLRGGQDNSRLPGYQLPGRDSRDILCLVSSIVDIYIQDTSRMRCGVVGVGGRVVGVMDGW